MNIEFGIEFL